MRTCGRQASTTPTSRTLRFFCRRWTAASKQSLIVFTMATQVNQFLEFKNSNLMLHHRRQERHEAAGVYHEHRPCGYASIWAFGYHVSTIRFHLAKCASSRDKAMARSRSKFRKQSTISPDTGFVRFFRPLLVLDVAVQGLLASSKNLTIGPSIAGCV
jgi:hypothetical protein